MAQPSYAPGSPLVSVIGPQFISPQEFNIIAIRSSGGDLFITDTNHKILITVKSCDTSMHIQRLLRDANDTPIALLREKNMSAHDRWNVYRGESNADPDIIFSTVSNHMIQFKDHVKVFLANKTSSRDACDFNIKGKWSKKNCTIYMGDTSAVIAQMNTMQPPATKDKFMVTVNPNVDYAFVVALIAIVDAMKTNDANAAGMVAAEGANSFIGTTAEVFSAGISS